MRGFHRSGFLKNLVKKLGLSQHKIDEKLRSKEVEDAITSDMNEFQKFGFTGTPVIVVNGIALHGAQPVEEIERVLQLTKK